MLLVGIIAGLSIPFFVEPAVFLRLLWVFTKWAVITTGLTILAILALNKLSNERNAAYRVKYEAEQDRMQMFRDRSAVNRYNQGRTGSDRIYDISQIPGKGPHKHGQRYYR